MPFHGEKRSFGVAIPAFLGASTKGLRARGSPVRPSRRDLEGLRGNLGADRGDGRRARVLVLSLREAASGAAASASVSPVGKLDPRLAVRLESGVKRHGVCSRARRLVRSASGDRPGLPAAQVCPQRAAIDAIAALRRRGRLPLLRHPTATPELKLWKEAGGRSLVGRAPTDDDSIFPNARGEATRPRSADLLRQDLETAELPTKFDGQPFEFNDLRHSFSTWLSSAGVPKETRDRLMGHVPQSVGERHPFTSGVARGLLQQRARGWG